MKADEITRLLECKNRRLRDGEDMFLFGPTGKRLWADFLSPKAGFEGCIDLVHKQNIPLLFAVEADGHTPASIEVLWRPAEGLLSFSDGEISLNERKLITWDDVAVSLQNWENKSERPIKIKLRLPEGFSLGKAGAFPCAAHGIKPHMRVESREFSEGEFITLMPRERKSVLVSAALYLEGEEAKADERLKNIMAAKDYDKLLGDARDEYMRWFERAPSFDCDDIRLTRCWYYRLYILRSNLAVPNAGRLRGLCFYEGRDHRMAKDAYSPSGWQFSRLIPLSTPLQVTDAVWLNRGETALSALETLQSCADEEGIFAVTSADECQREYANFSAWALYRLYLIIGDIDRFRPLLPAFKRDALSVYEKHAEGGCLQIERVHSLTGKEYQPSYWFFGDNPFPMAVRPAKESYTPLKRVDRSVYTYLNCLGLSRLCEAAGDGDSAKLLAIAERLKHEINEKMWDDETGYYYDLHFETEEKALVKNIVGIYVKSTNIVDRLCNNMVDRKW